MSRHSLHTLAVLSLCALAGAATAAPIGGGTTPIYVGSATFLGNGAIGVSDTSYANCVTQLQNGINYRVSNWGWVVTSIQPCHQGRWFAPPYLMIDGPALSDRQISATLRADAELRARYNIDAYEAEQNKLFDQPADGGGRPR